MRNPGGPYERLVCGVEEDKRLIGVRPVYPLLKLLLRGDCASRVVRIAEVYDVRALGQFRAGHKAVRRVTRQVDESRVAPAVVRARTAGHHVRVDIDRIDGIADSDLDIVAEKLLYVAAVALRAVGDEYLVGRDVDAAVLEVDLRRLLAEESVALLRTVAVEVLARRLVVDGLVHRLHDRVAKRLGDVAYAKTDYFRVWVRRLVRGDAMGYLGEEVACLYLRVVFVYVEHGLRALCLMLDV